MFPVSLLKFVFSRTPIEAQPDRIKFSEFDRNEAGFMAYYKRHIRPLKAQLEQRRLDSLKSLKTWFFRLIPASLLLSLSLIAILNIELTADHPLANIASLLNSLSIELLLFLIIVPPVASWLWLMLIAGSYGLGVRMAVMPKLSGYFGEGWTFGEKGNIDEHILKAAELSKEFNSIDSSNMLKGVYQDSEIQISELKLKRIRKAGEPTRTKEKVRFNGVSICIQVRRHFVGKTIGLKDKGNLNWLRQKIKYLKKVDIDNPEFESEFEVYSSDSEEAQHLLHDNLTPLLMELSESFRGSSGVNCTLSFSFNNNRLIILIDGGVDYFSEPSIFEPALQEQEFKQCLHQIGTIKQIVEQTNVDRYRRRS